VIKCESRFDPGAQSPRGAQGLMQLMPSTQAMLGVSNPFDPQHNVAAGTRYLAMLKQTFSGDLQLALAAYNAGPQAVVEAGYTIPAIAETQHYVRCVWTAYEHYREPGATPLLPGLRLPALSAEVRQTLVVSPLRLSSQVAHVGQRLTVQLEATNAGTRAGHGVLMVNYPGHLVSLMALTAGQETLAQLPISNVGPPAPGAGATTTYQLLWSHWRVWAPGERRTAVIVLVPRLAPGYYVPSERGVGYHLGANGTTTLELSGAHSVSVRSVGRPALSYVPLPRSSDRGEARTERKKVAERIGPRSWAVAFSAAAIR
jgi:hypothetical protein